MDKVKIIMFCMLDLYRWFVMSIVSGGGHRRGDHTKRVLGSKGLILV